MIKTRIKKTNELEERVNRIAREEIRNSIIREELRGLLMLDRTDLQKSMNEIEDYVNLIHRDHSENYTRLSEDTQADLDTIQEILDLVYNTHMDFLLQGLYS